MTDDHEIIDEALYRAILHGVAAGACRVAARETGDVSWARLSREQSDKAQVMLHQAAFARVRRAAAQAASSSSVAKP